MISIIPYTFSLLDANMQYARGINNDYDAGLELCDCLAELVRQAELCIPSHHNSRSVFQTVSTNEIMQSLWFCHPYHYLVITMHNGDDHVTDIHLPYLKYCGIRNGSKQLNRQSAAYFPEFCLLGFPSTGGYKQMLRFSLSQVKRILDAITDYENGQCIDALILDTDEQINCETNGDIAYTMQVDRYMKLLVHGNADVKFLYDDMLNVMTSEDNVKI